MKAALSFGKKPNAAFTTPAFLIERGFCLRHARDSDLPRLQELYADTRADEMAYVSWPLVAKQQFLNQQFALQHQHYLGHYADADFLVIDFENTLQGRYYLLRTAPEHLIVDISLMAAQRGQGIGRALIEASQQEAKALGRGMQLQVLQDNIRAQKLYEKLGFIVCDRSGMHLEMRWPAPSAINMHSADEKPNVIESSRRDNG